MKRIAKTLVAIMLAAAMLAACGAKTEDVSVDLGNDLTRAAEVSGDETTAKAETTKAAEESTDEAAAEETTANAETSSDVKELPEKPIYYDKYQPVKKVRRGGLFLI